MRHKMCVHVIQAYENYTSSLGWGFVCSSNHYTMNPEGRQDYINASQTHIGNNRGTPDAYGGMYNGPQREKFLDVENCPEELLLCFHNVPYTHVLHGTRYGNGNTTVLSWIYDSHTAGAATAARYVSKSLFKIRPCRHQHFHCSYLGLCSGYTSDK